MTLEPTGTRVFYGWRVVAGAFLLAIFGWGVGFYGPPVFLHAVREARGWSLPLVSAAVTTHFVIGAIVVANLPALYQRFGLPSVTSLGAIALALGVVGWAVAAQPWQLFAATLLSGAGWVALGAAAVNGIIAPWFVRTRPAALATAYNGASIGGVVFSPLWVAAIGLLGFPVAAALVGIVMMVAIWILASTLFARTPQQLGLQPDGDAPERPRASVTSPHARPLSGLLLWRDWKFWTLALGMAFGLFAQIGLIAQLFSLLVPALGEQNAGLAMGLATACAIGGRTVVGWVMPGGADRRLIACAGYAVQIIGSLLFILAGGTSVPVLLFGVVLFGSGIGNATSLPPLIAQVEFVKDEVQRVISLIVAVAQGTYAFAPAFFGALLVWGSPATPNVTLFFAAVAVVQG
ncbi:MAG TPA: MFS transporter, partial [Dongiaceae bacterium]